MTVHSGQLGLLTAPKIPANDPPHEIPNSPTGQPAGSLSYPLSGHQAASNFGSYLFTGAKLSTLSYGD